jgi:iron complex outermembrane receptor protein
MKNDSDIQISCARSAANGSRASFPVWCAKCQPPSEEFRSAADERTLPRTGAWRSACCVLCLFTHVARARAEEAPPVVVPELVTRVDAVYPQGVPRSDEERRSVLFVTIEADGTVSDAEIAESGGAPFDEAALAAVRQWRFQPASKDGTPVRARIRVPFLFAPPALPESPPQTLSPSRNEASNADAVPRGRTPAPPRKAASVPEVTVHGERLLRTEERSASDFTVRKQVLGAAPRQEGADTLRTVPGLTIGRAEGMAGAHRYMLRGFDADHGQDIEFRVGGIPINLPSHLHGQGYADLGFLIAETVDQIHASEGVYDPRQGDFAVAGSIDVRLGVERRGAQAKASYGSFDTFRQLLAWAPAGEDRQTFGAVQYVRTDGFGQNRHGQAASAIAQTRFGTGAWRYRALGIGYAARSNHAGVVRADDVESGRVGFYDAYPHATARAQNASAGRFLTGLFAEYRGETGENAEVGVFAGLDNFRLQQNFTGFIERSRTLEKVAGRGDLIEQRNRTRTVGLSARYRTAPYRPARAVNGTVEFGFSGRGDEIDQAQNLLDAAVHGQTWDERIDASIFGTDLAFWADLDWHFTKYLGVRVGMRGDVLYYEVDDRLGNFAPLTRPDDAFIVGFRRSAFGTAWGPRASAETHPFDGLSIRAAYGEGYRSPQARLLDDGEEAPFSKVRSADLGARFTFGDRYQFTLAGYHTHLSDDVAFDAEEGSLARIGETRRLGAVAYAEAEPLDGWIGAASVTVVDAELLEPPPATAQEPHPPFRVGQNLPFVPPVVVRVDLGARQTLARAVGRWDLVVRAGAGLSYLSPRPLPYGDFAEPVALLDASVGASWGALELSLEGFNLLGRRYAASEFNFASSWDPDAPRSRTPVRHTAAGPPFSWLATLGVSL